MDHQSPVNSFLYRGQSEVRKARSAMAITAVLFDMDGVLINSMPHHLSAFNQVLFPFGKNVSIEQIAGRSTSEVMFELLGQDVPREMLKELCRQKSSQARNSLKRAGKGLLVPGIEQLLSMLPVFMRRAICTSGSQETLEWLLTSVLDGVKFDCVVTSAQVQRSKPDPEVYVLAATTLKVPPVQCLVVEDSLNGTLAGYEAGCRVAHFVPNGSHSCACLAQHHIQQLTDVIALI